MIYTNQMEIHLDHKAIARDFLILEAKRENGDYRKSLVPDLALQTGHALAVAYKYGNCCYILYDRKTADWSCLKTALETAERDVLLHEMASDKLPDYLLAQLLCNAIPSLGSGKTMYHNLTGKLYYTHPSWRHGRGSQVRSFWTICIELTQERCVKLSVVSFCLADRKKNSQSDPQYLFDAQSYALRRLVRKDPDQKQQRFVMGSLDPSRKNTVPFLEFGSQKEFEGCKVGILTRFMEDAKELLSPYLTLERTWMDETAHQGMKLVDTKMDTIRDRIRQVPIYLEDTVQNDASAALAQCLKRELARYSKMDLQEGRPGPGDAVFRIVHNKDTYESCPEQDPYRDAPAYCAVQHLTLEDFQLNDSNKDGQKESALLRKALQEMAIKLDILQGHMNCYTWSDLNYAGPVCFVTVTEESGARGAKLYYRRLRVQPDGALEFMQWDDMPFWDDPEKEAIAAAFRTPKGKMKYHAEGLVYQDYHSIQVIEKTDRFTLPDMFGLQELLSSTRDDELLEVAPLEGVVASLLASAGPEEKPALEQILGRLQELGAYTTRKQLRAGLNLRTKLGRQVNEEIALRTGIRIGSGLKQKQNREQILGGTLDIRLFSHQGAQYYYSGYHAQSLQRSLPHACRIRRVTSTSGSPEFEPYLPLTEVDFVRASAWTVLPFPFKYLREWKPEEHRVKLPYTKTVL